MPPVLFSFKTWLERYPAGAHPRYSIGDMPIDLSWCPARLRLMLFGASLAVALCSPLPALDNGLARTPPMGWNSWNKFGCNVSEDLIKGAADAVVSSGMKDAGYQYVVIDDCWQVARDENGNIVPDSKRFPNGIKAVADYVHSKGLKFGIYSDAGTGTCQNRPGGRGYEFQDARQYAAWGVDYLKYDWCNHSTQDSAASYSIMRDALKKSGRPIVFSLCDWGSTKPWLWAADVGNLWRATGDIIDKWDGSVKWGGMGVVQILDAVDGLQSYAGPGHWNDPDMLEVGNGGMSGTEYRAHPPPRRPSPSRGPISAIRTMFPPRCATFGRTKISARRPAAFQHRCPATAC